MEIRSLCTEIVQSPCGFRMEAAQSWYSTTAFVLGICVPKLTQSVIYFITITQTRPCNILQYFTAVKMIIFKRKIVIFFLIFAQNIDCGYTLEPPQ